MIKPRRVTAVVVALVFAVTLIMSVGCTKYASPDDLQRLEEARKAAVSAEKEIDKVKTERKQVEQDLANKEAELKAVQEELEYVKAHLPELKKEETDE